MFQIITEADEPHFTSEPGPFDTVDPHFRIVVRDHLEYIIAGETYLAWPDVAANWLETFPSLPEPCLRIAPTVFFEADDTSGHPVVYSFDVLAISGEVFFRFVDHGTSNNEITPLVAKFDSTTAASLCMSRIPSGGFLPTLTDVP